MKPDTPRAMPLDRVERAHLKDPGDRSHTIYRYDPPADIATLVQRYWIPVWSVPPALVPNPFCGDRMGHRYRYLGRSDVR